MKRTCIFKTFEPTGNPDVKEIIEKVGWFHEWAAEADRGANYTVGICEDLDGQIHTPMPTHIKFTDIKVMKDPIMLGLCHLSTLNPEIQIECQILVVKTTKEEFESIPEECVKELQDAGWKYERMRSVWVWGEISDV